MININAMPCSNCMYFNGVKQPDKTEGTEYLACDKATDGKTNELLYIDGKKVKCDYWKKDD